jgi:hypothetical protein
MQPQTAILNKAVSFASVQGVKLQRLMTSSVLLGKIGRAPGRERLEEMEVRGQRWDERMCALGMGWHGLWAGWLSGFTGKAVLRPNLLQLAVIQPGEYLGETLSSLFLFRCHPGPGCPSHTSWAPPAPKSRRAASTCVSCQLDPGVLLLEGHDKGGPVHHVLYLSP